LTEDEKQEEKLKNETEKRDKRGVHDINVILYLAVLPTLCMYMFVSSGASTCTTQSMSGKSRPLRFNSSEGGRLGSKDQSAYEEEDLCVPEHRAMRVSHAMGRK
jgi:hypothetical protein